MDSNYITNDNILSFYTQKPTDSYELDFNKITITQKHGRRYFKRSVFSTLDADDVDNNTKEMEESIGR